MTWVTSALCVYLCYIRGLSRLRDVIRLGRVDGQRALELV